MRQPRIPGQYTQSSLGLSYCSFDFCYVRYIVHDDSLPSSLEHFNQFEPLSLGPRFAVANRYRIADDASVVWVVHEILSMGQELLLKRAASRARRRARANSGKSQSRVSMSVKE